MDRHLTLSLIFLTTIVAAIGCGDDGRRPVDGSVDSAPDASDGAPVDATDDAADADAGGATCPDDLRTGVTFPIDPEGIDGQIHASAVWDGERTVVVFNKPDPASNFDVFVTSVDCDGTPAVPTRINTTDFNDTDPAIAFDGDGFVVTWISDDGTGGTDNLHIFMRSLDADAQPASASDVELRTMREGEPVAGNHLASAVFATADGFVIAGTRGLAEIDRFHAFAQPIDAAGTLDGEAFEPAFEPMVTHSNVVGVQTPAGLVVAYDRAPDDALGQVVTATDDGSGTWELVVDGLVETTSPSLAAMGDTVIASLSGDIIPMATDVRLTDLSRPLAERTAVVLGASRRVDVAAKVLMRSPTEGAVAYFRLNAGAFGPLIVQRFSHVSGELMVGEEVEAASLGAAPYGPAFTHVVDDVYFVGWTEGMSPALRAMGRYVDLAP